MLNNLNKHSVVKIKKIFKELHFIKFVFKFKNIQIEIFT
jgi:hypothetical protein